MGIVSAYTLPEAREMLTLWKAAEKELASGQAKSYRVGSREVTLMNMDEIRGAINYFANLVEALEGKARTNRVTRVVPRDL